MDFELTEEHQMVRDMARRFAETEIKPKAAELDAKHEHPAEIVKQLGELKMMGIAVPEEYGGGGMDNVSYALALIEISKACAGTGTIMSVNNSLYCYPVMAYGTHEQKMKYLYPVAAGEKVGCYGLTESDAGSDPAAMRTTAEKDGDEWIINGTKNFITGGGIADTIIVLAQMDKNLGSKGIGLFAVDRTAPGFSSVDVAFVGGLACNASNLTFEDCRVPRENMIGNVGKGLKNILTGIDTARLFISAGAVGMAQSCMDSCIQYTRERHQFGKPIASFQLMQEAIARIQAEILSVRCLVYYVADLMTRKLPHVKELSSAKWLASELALRASAEAIRIHGAYGCTDEYPVAHHYRDAVLTTILGGTSEMHKLTIGRELLGINAMI